MFRKNLVIAFRSLKKDLPYTITNLAGMTIGITCCLLILSFVRYELSFDQFHAKRDRIFRVNYDVLMGGNQTISPSVPIFVGPEIKKRFPEVEDATRFLPQWQPVTIRHDNVFFDEKDFCYGDPNFFKIFDFKPLAGNLLTALEKPNSIVITKNTANKYFGKSDPIGQVLLLNNKKQFVVTAIVENVPSNSHFTFDLLASLYGVDGLDTLETKAIWNNPNYSTFLLLKHTVSAGELSKKIEDWVNPPHDKGESASQNAVHLRLESLKEVHFNTQVFNFKNKFATTDFKYVRMFIMIAVLVLLIACANYINLSTAKASVRAKEVGIRKTIGASFPQLFTQFLAESFLMTLVSVAMSIVAVYILLPFLNTLLGKQIPFSIFDSHLIAPLGAGTILVALLAGFYPSLVLSRFRPAQTLKGAFSGNGRSGIGVRKSLVVLQFAVSVCLILAAIIVRSQLEFMQSKKLGFDKDHVVIVHGTAELNNRLSAFSEDLRNISGVRDVALTWRSPFETVIGNGFSIKSHPTSYDDWHVVGAIAGDQNYLATLGIPLLAGRNFDASKIKGDSTVNEFIVNEAFLRHYRLTAEQVIGKEVILGLTGAGPVVGVMKDFHTSSMHELIGPIVLFNHPQYFGNILLRVGPGKLKPVLSEIANKWKGVVPARPFSYSFLDEEYDALYRTEQRLGTLMSLFCGLAIFITCMGLLGLMAFMAAQRTKEIGIRKVLGASVLHITGMLSKDFIRLVILSILVATPVAWYFMNKWLEDFAYRINIHWYVFVLTGIIAITIALATISFQSIKAAVANPVRSLRTE